MPNNVQWCLGFLVLMTSCGGGEYTQDAAPSDTAQRVSQSAAAPSQRTADGSAVSAAAIDGAAVFQRCASCHQATGAGIPGIYPPLAGSEIVAGPPARVIGIVLRGLSGPVVVRGATYNAAMPPFGTGQPLSDAEVAAVLTYVRSSWGNASPPITPQEVARERAR
ncbi:MAG: cytochrome c [bacterium]